MTDLRALVSRAEARLIKVGTHPRPVPLGPHRVAFLESEVEDWMAQRIAARVGS